MTRAGGSSTWAAVGEDLRLPVPPDWKPAFNDGAGWQVLLHGDVMEWLTEPSTDRALKKRCYFLLREMLVNGRCGRVKSVRGAGKGWLRSPLGGSGGSHFYLWWAPHGSPVLERARLADRQLLVRAVRHHDETGSPLDSGGPDDLLPLTLEEVFQPEGDSPFSPEQVEIATGGTTPVTLVNGTPGSGKTTALWMAGSFATGTKALYITYSRGLARTAEDYFRAFGPAGTSIDVLTFEELLTELAGATPGSIDFMAPSQGATRLGQAIAELRQSLGQWSGHLDELYAELNAHCIGRALPIAFRDLPPTEGPVLPSSVLREARGDVLSDAQARVVGTVAERLVDGGWLPYLFPGPFHARQLLFEPHEPPPSRFGGVSALLIDEIQDLTPVEAMLLLTLALRIGVQVGTMPSLLIAGDEGQTVRPTDFDWGWLGDLITTVLGPRLGERTRHALTVNLRSPRLIASVIANTRSQYQRFDKSVRPGGVTEIEADDTVVGRVLYCRAHKPQDWADLTTFFAESPAAQLVYPGHRLPDDIDTAAAR